MILHILKIVGLIQSPVLVAKRLSAYPGPVCRVGRSSKLDAAKPWTKCFTGIVYPKIGILVNETKYKSVLVAGGDGSQISAHVKRSVLSIAPGDSIPDR